MLCVFILPPKEGLFVINFMPFAQRTRVVFVRHEIQFPGCPRDQPAGKQMISA